MATTREAAIEMLKNGVSKLGTSEAFQNYLEFSRKFHHYSLHNTMMILFQRPDATLVAGFNKWKEMGRSVKKGEKGIAIWAPLFGKREKEDGTDETFLRGFKLVYVFDVAQTDGKPIPENPVAPKRLEGEDGGLYALLAAHVTDSGLSLIREAVIGDDQANGSYNRVAKEIRVRPDLSPIQSLKTLAHEVAHWKLHSDDDGASLTRDVKETEAEAAAFLALSHFGIRADEYSFGYVAGWSKGNVRMIEKSLSRIERAADAIIKAIEERLPKGEPASVAA
jgi:antirestriction protein ArdC